MKRSAQQTCNISQSLLLVLIYSKYSLAFDIQENDTDTESST